MNYVNVTPDWNRTASTATTRTDFLRKTYSLVGISILAMAALEVLFINLGWGKAAFELIGKSKYSWLLVLGGFMVVSFVAQKMAHSEVSLGKQFLGLGIYVVGEALVFLPMIYLALAYKPEAVGEALFFTGVIVAALTFAAFTMKTDFSFLGGFVRISCVVALGVIVASIIFGFTLGTLFSAIMCVVMGASILHTTGTLIHHYPTNMYVGGALALFAGIATLFWYVLSLVMNRD